MLEDLPSPLDPDYRQRLVAWHPILELEDTIILWLNNLRRRVTRMYSGQYLVPYIALWSIRVLSVIVIDPIRSFLYSRLIKSLNNYRSFR